MLRVRSGHNTSSDCECPESALSAWSTTLVAPSSRSATAGALMPGGADANHRSHRRARKWTSENSVKMQIRVSLRKPAELLDEECEHEVARNFARETSQIEGAENSVQRAISRLKPETREIRRTRRSAENAQNQTLLNTCKSTRRSNHHVKGRAGTQRKRRDAREEKERINGEGGKRTVSPSHATSSDEGSGSEPLRTCGQHNLHTASYFESRIKSQPPIIVHQQSPSTIHDHHP